MLPWPASMASMVELFCRAPKPYTELAGVPYDADAGVPGKARYGEGGAPSYSKLLPDWVAAGTTALSWSSVVTSVGPRPMRSTAQS